MRRRYGYGKRMYGGYKLSLNSNRDGHLTAAMIAGMLIGGAGLVSGSLLVMATGAVTAGWEALASCDMDVETRTVKGSPQRQVWVMFWKPYSRMIPRHRSPLSHSLLIGTPLRLLYIFTLPLMATACYITAPVVQGWMLTKDDWQVLPNAILDAFTTFLHSNAELIFLLAHPLVIHILLGCFIADSIHMLKDGFSPWQLFFGVGDL